MTLPQSLQQRSQPELPTPGCPNLLFFLLLLFLSCLPTPTFPPCTALSGSWSSEESDLCLLPSGPHQVFHLQPIKIAACASKIFFQRMEPWLQHMAGEEGRQLAMFFPSLLLNSLCFDVSDDLSIHQQLQPSTAHSAS